MARSFRYESSIEAVARSSWYTGGRLKANPLTASLASDYDAFDAKLTTVAAAEQSLNRTRVIAQGAVDGAWQGLQPFPGALSKKILALTKNKRNVPLYQLFFDKDIPSRIGSRSLALQVATMKPWVVHLKASSEPVLQACGTELDGLITTGESALASLEAVDESIKAFRNYGDRAILYDTFNGLNKSTGGKLDKMPSDNKSLHLPVTFARGFFEPDGRSDAPEEKPRTSLDVQADINRNVAEKTKLDAELKTVQAAEAAEAANEAALAAKRQKAADLKASAAAAAAQAKQLEEELDHGQA